AGGAGPSAGAEPPRTAGPPDATRRLRWVALAFAPSSLMLGVTTFLTSDLAPVPLLWTVPLTLYLLSFVVAFSPGARRERAHQGLLAVVPLFAVLLAAFLLLGIQQPLGVVAGVHLLAFLVVSLACHGELARDRPAPRFLTGFYLWIALGGALGGAFNALVAPLAFDHALEYPLALVIACLLLPNRSVLAPSRWTRRLDVLVPVAIGATVAGLLLVLRLADAGQQAGGRAYVLGLAAGIVLSLGRRPLRFGLSLAALLAAGAVGLSGEERVIFAERSFFGVHRVEVPEGTRVHRLLHGTTLHGAQDRAPGRSREPLTYYHRTGPVGELMAAIPDRPARREAGVIGLGTGTMACYSRAGERWTFYEIDPTVERIARDRRLFTYLRDCPGSFDVVLGDARLSLRRAPDRRLGVLVVDAFNSDAVPVHLLTREALDLYRAKLAPGGVLAFNVSSRYLALEPVLGELARARGLVCRGHAEGPEAVRGIPFKVESHWVAMARRPADLGRLGHDRRWRPCARDAGARLWTDDYSNVLAAL
ncbi:MAG: fused MFS/spermidine synthase, partial [Actinomycetota bacterium]|nr:fused MFS/spermidine synthase [Actinomycetota bacterium]